MKVMWRKYSRKMDSNKILILIFGDPLQRDEQRNIDQPFTALFFQNYKIEANTTMVKKEGSGGKRGQQGRRVEYSAREE